MIASEETLTRETILAHLETMLADRRFASAERNTRFLRYVVERTLDGKANEIKETVIAYEVYGRNASYDPKSDSIVRVEATRLRQKLRNYYENEGRNAAIRIVLPSGTYVPSFENRAPEFERPAGPLLRPPSPVPRNEPNLPAPTNRSLAWAGMAAAVLFLVSIPAVKASRASAVPALEAVTAWQEGVALLNQDPHTGQAEHGAPPTLLRAIERLEYAVARDPKIAPAWATLAEAYDYVFPYVGRNSVEDSRRAEAGARNAVALDGKLSAAHHMLGLVQWLMKWDFAAAEVSYRRAIELDERNVYALLEYADLLRETGRSSEALTLIARSRQLLPALPQLAAKQAELELDLGQVDAAEASSKAALQMNRTYLRAYVTLAAAQEAKADYPSALGNYEYVLTVDPSDRRALPAYGYLLGRLGHHAEALAVAAKLQRINSEVRNCAFQVAVVYAGLDDNARALEWLEKAWRTRQTHFPFAAVESRFKDIRHNVRFRQLLARVGLNAPMLR